LGARESVHTHSDLCKDSAWAELHVCKAEGTRPDLVTMCVGRGLWGAHAPTSSSSNAAADRLVRSVAYSPSSSLPTRDNRGRCRRGRSCDAGGKGMAAPAIATHFNTHAHKPAHLAAQPLRSAIVASDKPCTTTRAHTPSPAHTPRLSHPLTAHTHTHTHTHIHTLHTYIHTHIHARTTPNTLHARCPTPRSTHYTHGAQHHAQHSPSAHNPFHSGLTLCSPKAARAWAMEWALDSAPAFFWRLTHARNPSNRLANRSSALSDSRAPPLPSPDHAPTRASR
jgi:hypothetical protein